MCKYCFCGGDEFLVFNFFYCDDLDMIDVDWYDLLYVVFLFDG